MSSQKLPSELNVQTLLEALQETVEADAKPTVDKREPFDEITRFLCAFGIQPGEHLVRSHLFLRLYRLWSKEPLSNQKFWKALSAYIPGREVHDASYYLINLDAFTIGRRTFDLLNSKKKDVRKSPRYKQHFESFISHYSITKGTFWVEGRALYHLYDKWAYSVGRKQPLYYKDFLSLCRLYFSDKRPRGSVLFAVDKSIEKYLPPDHLEQIREGNKRIYGRAAKEKSNPPKPG